MKDSKDSSSSSQVITCYECNEHGHLKKECPTYLKEKGRALAKSLSDSCKVEFIQSFVGFSPCQIC